MHDFAKSRRETKVIVGLATLGMKDTAIIVVTHDEKIIPTFRRIYHIRDGRTVEEAGEGLSL
jgi:ABC-type lipoprotein export system ATPase subunit